MSATRDSTLADAERRIADLERQLADCQAERDEALQREAATAEGLTQPVVAYNVPPSASQPVSVSSRVVHQLFELRSPCRGLCSGQ